MIRRIFFWWRYATGNAPWDTGITPPEIVRLVEEKRLPPGRAIDLGCGTGTNALYLARHGWQVVGIDLIRQPIRAARRRAAQAGFGDRARFIVGSITALPSMALGGPFDLALDIGCGHSLPADLLPQYAASLAAIVRPGGLFMLYMFRPTPERQRGLAPEAVEALFSPAFRLAWSSLGQDSAAASASAWYQFARVEGG